jgi:hypothetical protein
MQLVPFSCSCIYFCLSFSHHLFLLYKSILYLFIYYSKQTTHNLKSFPSLLHKISFIWYKFILQFLILLVEFWRYYGLQGNFELEIFFPSSFSLILWAPFLAIDSIIALLMPWFRIPQSDSMVGFQGSGSILGWGVRSEGSRFSQQGSMPLG